MTPPKININCSYVVNLLFRVRHMQKGTNDELLSADFMFAVFQSPNRGAE